MLTAHSQRNKIPLIVYTQVSLLWYQTQNYECGCVDVFPGGQMKYVSGRSFWAWNQWTLCFSSSYLTSLLLGKRLKEKLMIKVCWMLNFLLVKSQQNGCLVRFSVLILTRVSLWGRQFTGHQNRPWWADLRSACFSVSVEFWRKQEVSVMCLCINTHQRTVLFFILILSTDCFCWYRPKD